MAWADHLAYQPVITGDPAAIKPLGDFVLVRPLSDEAGGKLMGTALSNLGALSEFTMTKDYRYRWNRPRGNRYGEVLAVGEGDRMVGLACADCGGLSGRLLHIDEKKKRHSCSDCGGEVSTYQPIPGLTADFRSRMQVAPGDIVVFPQVPANEIEINGEKLVFLHAEQHVFAVIDPEPAVIESDDSYEAREALQNGRAA